jgi:hypothetical protein
MPEFNGCLEVEKWQTISFVPYVRIRWPFHQDLLTFITIKSWEQLSTEMAGLRQISEAIRTY